MLSGWRRCVLGAVVTSLLGGVSGAQPGGMGGAASEVTLFAQADALVPGETSMLGLRFEIPDAWHIYQPSQNDTGLEPMAEWSSDGELGFGEFQWPAGHRFTQPGEILDHGYEGTVLLMVPVEVPASIAVGTMVSVSASVEWLECDAELCVPGSAEVSIELPVRASALEGDDANAFESARAGMGVPLVGDASEPVTLSWDGATMVVSARSGDGALSFVPAVGCSRVRGLYAAGASDTGELRLEFEDPEGDVVGWIWADGDREGDGGASGVWFVRTDVGEGP